MNLADEFAKRLDRFFAMMGQVNMCDDSPEFLGLAA
jgi:hypothetical protein